VVVENVGLHIGGGPNDDATKAPFKAAIELHFPEFLKCYREVVEPEKGGTFGVDILVKRPGGQAEIRQPRTAMGGTKFRDCVMDVFRRVEFQKPKLGPTVFSYSLRFSIRERKVQ
jgi:hypothetical protein